MGDGLSGGEQGDVEYRTVRALVVGWTRLTATAFDRHVRRGYFPRPRRLPGRPWRWYTAADVVLILDLCGRRRWLTG